MFDYDTGEDKCSSMLERAHEKVNEIIGEANHHFPIMFRSLPSDTCGFCRVIVGSEETHLPMLKKILFYVDYYMRVVRCWFREYQSLMREWIEERIPEPSACLMFWYNV